MSDKNQKGKGQDRTSYGWLQDRIVRVCTEERVETIEQGKEILRHEVEYNDSKPIC